MRIHGNITSRDVYEASGKATVATGANVYVERCEEHGSRSRARAYDVKLSGDGTLSKRRTNAGTRYAPQTEYAATWDQWGWFLAHLFSVDPTIKCWAYAGLDDFNARTDHKFVLVAA